MGTIKKIFLTGGTGFIGSTLRNRLAEDNTCHTFALSRKNDQKNSPNLTFVHGDIFDTKTYEKTLISCDVIMHLAGEININQSLSAPRALIETNLGMLFNILESLRKNDKKPLIIFTSTDRVYGKTIKRSVDETEHYTPIEPYTASKILCENLLETYYLLYKIPYIILRIDGVYGPNQPRSMFISDIIQKMITQDFIPVGNLSLQKNFVYVDDVVEAIMKAVRAPKTAQNTVYNIGGTSVSLKKIFTVTQKILEKRLNKKIHTGQDPALNRPPAIEVHPFRLSTAKAEKMLRWKTKVSLEQGLNKTINHFLTNHEKNK